jgi:subtilisin family serine protease
MMWLWTSRQRSAGILLGAALLAAPLAASRAGGDVSRHERAAMLDSGIVGAAVVDLLETEERARVMIAFAAPEAGSAARDGETPKARARRAIEATGGAILARMAPGDFVLEHRYRAIGALAGTVSARGLLQLLGDPTVLRVDLDEGGAGHLAQSVPLVNLDLLHGAGLTGSGVQVAVLDSGVDLTHPDVGSAVIAEKCFCSDSGAGCCPDGSVEQSGAGSAQDDHGHGTNVTGIVTSDGTAAPTGGAPDAEIVAIKVLDSNNSFCCASDVVAGLDWILHNRPEVDIVNMSLGTYALFIGECDSATAFTLAFAAAIDALRATGVLTVVSSGNDRSGTRMTAPACVANALSVGAVWDSNVGSKTLFGCTDSSTQADRVTCFSNSNATTDLFAPGAPMSSGGLGGGTSTFYGTSQAAPVVAACAAALLEAYPGLGPNQLESALESSTVTVTDDTNGLSFPRVDCQQALQAAPGLSLPALSVGGAALLLGLLAGSALWRLGGRALRPRRSARG